MSLQMSSLQVCSHAGVYHTGVFPLGTPHLDLPQKGVPHTSVSPGLLCLHTCEVLQMCSKYRWEFPLAPARFRLFLLLPFIGLGSRYRCARGKAPPPSWLHPLISAQVHKPEVRSLPRWVTKLSGSREREELV